MGWLDWLSKTNIPRMVKKFETGSFYRFTHMVKQRDCLVK